MHVFVIKQCKRHEYVIDNECKYFFNCFLNLYCWQIPYMQRIFFHTVLLEYKNVFFI